MNVQLRMEEINGETIWMVEKTVGVDRALEEVRALFESHLTRVFPDTGVWRVALSESNPTFKIICESDVLPRRESEVLHMAHNIFPNTRGGLDWGVHRAIHEMTVAYRVMLGLPVGVP